MPDEKISVELTAEQAKLKRELDKAKGTVKKFGEDTKQTFKNIGTTLVAAFAVSKIVSFVKTGITEFAKFERTLDQVTGKIERTGQGFDGLREQVENYIRTAESATRFSKFQLGESLDNLIAKTNDYNTALALNEKAMDLAVFANVDLKVAADALALAYEGNTSGMSQLARIMGMSTEEAKDLDTVFAELEKRTAGAAREEEGLAVGIDKLNNSLNDAAELLGKEVGPALVDIGIVAVTGFTKAVDISIKVVKTLANSLAEIAARAVSAAMLLVNIWTGPKEAIKNFNAEQKAISEASAEDMAKIWVKSAEKKNDIDLKALRQNFRLKKREVENTKETEAEKVAAVQEGTETVITFQQQLIDFMNNANLGQIALFQMSIENIKNMATQISEETAKVFEDFYVSMVESNESVADAFKELGKRLFKMIVNTFGQALIAEGAKYTAQAIAALISVVGAGAAPGLFAAGLYLSAAGGIIKGMVATLAEGGIVTAPTQAIIGEAGPEAVIPLDKVNSFGGSIDMRNARFTMNFPGVKNIRDLQGKRFAQSAERQLASVLSEMNARSGRKAIIHG